MEIEVKIYSCYKLTYSRIYKKILSYFYSDSNVVNNAKLTIIDISVDKNGKPRNIQSQRNIEEIPQRTINVFENGKLKHIIGLSNTNYDYDRKNEFDIGLSNKKVDKFGGDGYHANTYFKQGANKIFTYYFDNVSKGVDLSFYLLDIDEKRTYPHSLYNVLTYRELETIGFKILNINEVDFSAYEKECNSKIINNSISFGSINKYLRDIAYISKRNTGNTPSFLQCNEVCTIDSDGSESYKTEKYIYTFKSLSAQAYESMMRCWCLKVLANKENIEIEFRLGKQYFAFEEEEQKVAGSLTQPIINTLKSAGITIDYLTNEAFMNEKKQADSVYERYKQRDELRNQTLFRNNLRRKGIPFECSACGVDNASILDAAHIYEVNRVKEADNSEITSFISDNHLEFIIDEDSEHRRELFYKKYCIVNSGENGIWLCKNHHGLFDRNYYTFDSENGKILLKFDCPDTAKSFMASIKNDCKLSSEVFTTATKAFLKQRMMYF